MRRHLEVEMGKQPALAAHAFQLSYCKHVAAPVRGLKEVMD
jgi:hypothetical protein